MSHQSNNKWSFGNQRSQAQLPIAKNEDIEFSAELADADDLEAQERAELADTRQESE